MISPHCHTLDAFRESLIYLDSYKYFYGKSKGNKKQFVNSYIR